MNIENINIQNIGYYVIESNTNNWFITSILYGCYNSVLLIPVLIAIKQYISKNKDIKYISIAVMSIFSLLLIIVYFLLINVDINIKNLEMPAIYAIDKINTRLRIVYGFIVMISIFTTAISLGISFLKDLNLNRKNYFKVAMAICISSIFFSRIGFSNLVNCLYPILGIGGIIQGISIIIKT